MNNSSGRLLGFAGHKASSTAPATLLNVHKQKARANPDCSLPRVLLNKLTLNTDTLNTESNWPALLQRFCCNH